MPECFGADESLVVGRAQLPSQNEKILAQHFPGKVTDKGVAPAGSDPEQIGTRSEEHTSELQSLMRISYAVFCLKKKTQPLTPRHYTATRPTITTARNQQSHTTSKPQNTTSRTCT